MTEGPTDWLIPTCDSCGEPAEDLQEVEDRDDETGYLAISAVCGACRGEVKQREADEHGGLRADALAILGVDEDWMEG